MSTNNWRFTVFVLPKYFDGQKLTLSIVLLPRNQNPLSKAIEEPGLEAPPFAEAELKFQANIIPLEDVTAPPIPPLSLDVATPANKKKLFEMLANKFQITNQYTINKNAYINGSSEKAPDPLSAERSVKKYLPMTYRKSFNFVAPRTPNAIIDESYRCQVRSAKPNSAFQRSPEQVSWGKVFAYGMRQPFSSQRIRHDL